MVGRRSGSLRPVEIPERVEIDDGRMLVLSWPDGAVTRVTAASLRAACECATCLGPDGKASWIGDAGSVRVLDARLVGSYAINFTFGPDQHGTGIYPFDRLRHLGELSTGREH